MILALHVAPTQNCEGLTRKDVMGEFPSKKVYIPIRSLKSTTQSESTVCSVSDQSMPD
ncbi:MAG: hypothetical protein ACMXYF_01760 [Candidatus Woesearchaeota archaeon]